MKALLVTVMALTLLAGCSSMGTSSGSSMGDGGNSGPISTNDENIFHSYSGGQ